jgi:hypothetical protein
MFDVSPSVEMRTLNIQHRTSNVERKVRMRHAAALILVGAVAGASAIVQGVPRAITRPTTSPATQPAALSATIDKAVKLLEAQKHEEVVRLLIEPKELERWLESTTMERVIDGFKGRKAEDLLLVLKQVRERTPTLDADGRQATFKLDGAVRKDVDFARIGDKWYLKGP